MLVVVELLFKFYSTSRHLKHSRLRFALREKHRLKSRLQSPSFFLRLRAGHERQIVRCSAHFAEESITGTAGAGHCGLSRAVFSSCLTPRLTRISLGNGL